MIDFLDLIHHLPGAHPRSESDGQFSILVDAAILTLEMAHWAESAEQSVLCVRVIPEEECHREILVRVDEFNTNLRQIADAALCGGDSVWVGSSRARHGLLRAVERTCVELATSAAARRWIEAEACLESGKGVLTHGEGLRAASLEIVSGHADNTVTFCASLAGHRLFTYSTAIPDAPAAAVQAVVALNAARPLEPSTSLDALREAQVSWLRACGVSPVAEVGCPACRAEATEQAP